MRQKLVMVADSNSPLELVVEGGSTRRGVDSIVQMFELIANLEAASDKVRVIPCVHVKIIAPKSEWVNVRLKESM